MDNQRNLLLAVVLSGLLILGWDMAMRYFYPQASLTGQTEEVATVGESPSAATTPGTIDAGLAPTAAPIDLADALAAPERVRIDAPRVEGSINLIGARIDDIELKDHRATVDEDSGPVQLFSPQGTPEQYFAQFGWVGQGVTLPNANTLWEASGESLTDATPVTLTHDNGEGQLFTITLSIDDNYMIIWSRGADCDQRHTVRWIVSKDGKIIMRHLDIPPHHC